MAPASVLLWASGCGYGSVDVEVDSPQPGSEQVCRALLDALPEVVDDAVRRDVEPETGRTAAWGSPPVVLRCGMPLPADYQPDAQLIDLNGVGWLPVDGEGGTFFSATDREVIVEVSVPEEYLPEYDVLLDLAPAIKETVPGSG